MAAEDNPLAGIGPYAVPTRERINDTALAAIAGGGEVMEETHRSQRVDYSSDPEGLRELRKQSIGRNWTCSCGQTGTVVEMPPESFPLTADCEYGSVRPSGPLRICVRCDAGHLMPNLAHA